MMRLDQRAFEAPELAMPGLGVVTPPEPFITLPRLRSTSHPQVREGAAVAVSPSPEADPPMAPAALPPSVQDVLQLRRDQVERWGHTPEKDAERPLSDFLHDVDHLARAAREDAQFRMGGQRIRKRLVKLAALTLATIDRLDMAPPPEPAE